MSMQIMITATDQLTTIGGVPCRVWAGVTAAGVPCKVFVHRLAVHNADNSEEFERELAEQVPPGEWVDLRQVL